MLNNFMGKAKCSSAKTSPIKAKSKHCRIQSLDAQLAFIQSKDQLYRMIDSPNLNHRLSQITNHFEDKLLSRISTPTNKTFKRLQRRKYIDIKEKIYQSVVQFQSLDLSNLEQLFTYKQSLLSEYLTQFSQEISKECRQKGDILKYLWNSMFGMIEHIAQQLAQHLRKHQASELNNHIKQHKDYQSLIETYKKKQQHLVQKINDQKITISKLIYELRFKRKELNKMYKNQKILTNRLNDIKNENLQIQSNFIEIVSSLKDLPQDTVEQMLKAREEITKSKKTKIKVKGNKKINRIEIREELKDTSIDAVNELLQEIKDIATNELNSPRLITTLIEAAIQNFGIHYDDKKTSNGQLVEFIETSRTAEAAVQANLGRLARVNKIQQFTQFSYGDRLSNNQVANKIIQTYTTQPTKKYSEKGSSTEDVIKKYVTWNFRIIKTVSDFIRPKIQESVIVMTPLKLERGHKKHMSDFDVLGGKYYDNNTQQFNERSLSKFKNNEFNKTDSNTYFKIDSKHKEKEKVGRVEKKSTKMIKISRKSFVPLSQRGKSAESKKKDQASQSQLQFEDEEKMIKTIEKRSSSGLGSPNRTKNPSIFSRTKKRKGTITSINHYNSIKSDLARMHLMDNQNMYGFSMDEDKKNEINNFFVNNGKNNFYFDLEEQSEQDDSSDNKELYNEVITKTLNHIDLINDRSLQKKRTLKDGKPDSKRDSQDMVIDEQDMLLNVCRNKYYQRGKKRKERSTLFKYRDEFTSVKQNIEMIAKDVRQLMAKKEDYLKKVINSKSLKNIYKILMMTFAKAYDCYNKGIIIKNLVFPLFESLSLIYGAINTTQVYKKMINFIACLSVKTDNTIFKFFLFFLGLDRKNPYSEHVTISEVYLSLALLEKISIEGKITLNIDSIYTDTNRIKDELIRVLKQQKIPENLCTQIKKRVDEQLQSSSSLRNSDDEDAQLKINIYNIILLIIQQVIKCKHRMKQNFHPVFQCCEQYQNFKRVPIILVQIILAMIGKEEEQARILKVINGIKKANKTQTLLVQQFCSILFDNNITSLRQLVQDNFLPIYRCKIPSEFAQMASKKTVFNNYKQQFELKLFTNLMKIRHIKSTQQVSNIEIMKKLIFVKNYFKITEELSRDFFGDNLSLIINCMP